MRSLSTSSDCRSVPAHQPGGSELGSLKEHSMDQVAILYEFCPHMYLAYSSMSVLFECKTWRQHFSANLAASGREIRSACEDVFLVHFLALPPCAYVSISQWISWHIERRQRHSLRHEQRACSSTLEHSQASLEKRRLRLEFGTSYQLTVQVQCGPGRTRKKTNGTIETALRTQSTFSNSLLLCDAHFVKRLCRSASIVTAGGG